MKFVDENTKIGEFTKLSKLASLNLEFTLYDVEMVLVEDYIDKRKKVPAYAFLVYVSLPGGEIVETRFTTSQTEYWESIATLINQAKKENDVVTGCYAVRKSFTPKGEGREVTYYRLTDAPAHQEAEQEELF